MDIIYLLKLDCVQKYVHQHEIKSLISSKNNYDHLKKLKLVKHLEEDIQFQIQIL